MSEEKTKLLPTDVIYRITVTTPYTKKRDAKRKRGWAEMTVVLGRGYCGFWQTELHGAN